MPTDPLFDTGFPGPSVTSKDIDTLGSRISQAAGVRDAAVKRGQAAANMALAEPIDAADRAVDALVQPINQILTDAGTTAAHTVATGQLATVKALQQPLSVALKYGYVSKGTPLLNPVGPPRKKRGVKKLDQLPPPPPPPAIPPAPPATPVEYAVLLSCARKDIMAVPGLPGEFLIPGYAPPPGYIIVAYINMLPKAVAPWLQQYGESLYYKAISDGKCVPTP